MDIHFGVQLILKVTCGILTLLYKACISSRLEEFDYIVIGTGSGGAAAASKIVASLPRASVLLLESGPPDDSESFT